MNTRISDTKRVNKITTESERNVQTDHISLTLTKYLTYIIIITLRMSCARLLQQRELCTNDTLRRAFVVTDLGQNEHI